MIKSYKSSLFLLLVFLASCSKPALNSTRERFIVTSNNLNIRNDPTQLSRTIGTLTKGDTVTALASDNYWVMVKVGDQTGFVSNQYLKRLGPIKAPKFISFIERNANISSWQFWVIGISLIIIWIGAEIGVLRYHKKLKKNLNVNPINISLSPVVVFVSSILFALLYLYWKDEVIETLSVNFSIIPKSNNSIGWFIWILIVVIAIAILIDLIGSIYKSGLKQGSLIFLAEQGINLIIFATTFLLTISLFLGAIVFLIIFFAILYTIIVTENSKSFLGSNFK